MERSNTEAARQLFPCFTEERITGNRFEQPGKITEEYILLQITENPATVT